MSWTVVRVDGAWRVAQITAVEGDWRRLVVEGIGLRAAYANRCHGRFPARQDAEARLSSIVNREQRDDRLAALARSLVTRGARPRTMGARA